MPPTSSTERSICAQAPSSHGASQTRERPSLLLLSGRASGCNGPDRASFANTGAREHQPTKPAAGMADDTTVHTSQIQPAMTAAMSIASALDLAVDDAIVLHNSNKLALRLLPCNVLARVAHVGQEVAQSEIDVAQRLVETESPVAALEPRVEPRVDERDGFAVTQWTFYAPATAGVVLPADYANALKRLHAGMALGSR